MKDTEQKKLAIIVPCYNEESVLKDSVPKLQALLARMTQKQLVAEDSYLLLVNDGSTDSTWDIIQSLSAEDKHVHGVSLAVNAGHQNALMAGYATAYADESVDMMVCIDADLQDDEQCISDMVENYHSGHDVVYGVRMSRSTDTLWKRATAKGFYKLMQCLGVKTVYNSADFRLLSRRAVGQLLRYNERNLYLRGIIPMLGYDSTTVEYDRRPRTAGETHYGLTRMVSLAFDGITSFSSSLIHAILFMGGVFLIISIGILAWVLWAWYSDHAVPGWSSLMVSVWFCTGCLLIALGIVGEYIGKIYKEVKNRPRYNIDEYVGMDEG